MPKQALEACSAEPCSLLGSEMSQERAHHWKTSGLQPVRVAKVPRKKSARMVVPPEAQPGRAQHPQGPLPAPRREEQHSPGQPGLEPRLAVRLDLPDLPDLPEANSLGRD